MGGNAEICRLLLAHGAEINALNSQKRTPLWRAAFMDKRECVQLLLEHGGDPRIASDQSDTPQMVAPSAELKAALSEWPRERTDELKAQREAANTQQWQPPPRAAP